MIDSARARGRTARSLLIQQNEDVLNRTPGHCVMLLADADGSLPGAALNVRMKEWCRKMCLSEKVRETKQQRSCGVLARIGY